jgi:RimK family alpha-L-glutamate ligase
MKVGILGQRGGWHTTALHEACRRRGIAAAVLPVTRLTARLSHGPILSAGDEGLDCFDVILVRAIPGGSLEQVIFRMDALSRLEAAGVRVVNSAKVIERTVDKYYTSWLLEQAGLPTPRTIVAEQFEDALLAFEALGGDVIVKPIFGSEGRGMVRVTEPDVAYRVFRALELGRYVYYLQEFLPHGRRDIRVLVMGGRVEAAMERVGDGWKTNVSQGAQARPLDVDGGLEALALGAARVVGTDYAGVDILPLEDGGYAVIEVNGIPGWRGLQHATGINLADRLIDHVLAEKP